jgi:hypothetical protein
MPAPPKHEFSYAVLGASYKIQRQRAAQLVGEFGWNTVANPDALFSALLGRDACLLRWKLSDPAFRAAAARALSTAPFRMAVRPRASRKPKSLSQH